MSVLYISEFEFLGVAPSPSGWPVMAPVVPAVAEQNVSIGASSQPSNAFNAATSFVMIATDAICALAFGTAPTAVTTAHRMAANETRFYSVPAGQHYKVAVIAAT